MTENNFFSRINACSFRKQDGRMASKWTCLRINITFKIHQCYHTAFWGKYFSSVWSRYYHNGYTKTTYIRVFQSLTSKLWNEAFTIKFLRTELLSLVFIKIFYSWFAQRCAIIGLLQIFYSWFVIRCSILGLH